jgi:hypothetical protein
VEPNNNVYMYKECPPSFSLVPTFTDGREGGRGAISVAMKKKWRKNPPKTVHFTTW